MKAPTITKIDIFKLKIPFSRPYRTSLGWHDRTNSIVVRIHSSEGIYGIGEGSPDAHVTGETQEIGFEAAKFFGQFLIGRNPLAIEALVKGMDNHLTHNTAINAAFDLALYDLLAKRAEMPLYTFLGGEKRTLHTCMTVGIDSPDAMAQEALEFRDKGIHSIKVKLGTSQADDVARIQAIQDAVGKDVPLRLDGNQGWNPTTAIQVLRALAHYNIQFCEEPVAHWNNIALRRVREHSPIPIMADESISNHHDAFRLASMGACDYFNIKMAKSGGIHTALRIDAIAQSSGIQCMVGCMEETRLGLSAAAHLVSARPNIIFADLDSAFYLSEDPITGGITFKGDQIVLPDTPGHGADFEAGYLEKQESVSIS